MTAETSSDSMVRRMIARIRKMALAMWSLPAPVAALWLFLAGLILRVGFILLSGLHQQPINFLELERIGRNLAQANFFGNPYPFPTGSTAHGAPLYPFLLSMIYRCFGLGSGAHLATLVMNSAFASAQYALLPFLAEACGIRRQIGMLAGLIGVAVPFRLLVEVRGWEASLSALLLAGMVLATAHWYRAAVPSVRSSALYGAGWGLVFLGSPQLLPVCALFVAAPLFWVARGRRRSAILSVSVVLLAITFVILPWTIRNYVRLGGLVFVRSNVGIELATSNFEGATPFMVDNMAQGPDSFQARRHPFPSISEAMLVREMGEIAYNKWRLREAWDWVKKHPKDASWLTLRRFFHFWFMPAKAPRIKGLILYPVVVLAFFGLVRLLRRSWRMGWLLAAVLLGYPLAYYFIQLSTRYRYPMEWCLTFLSVFALLCPSPAPHAGRVSDAAAKESHE